MPIKLVLATDTLVILALEARAARASSQYVGDLRMAYQYVYSFDSCHLICNHQVMRHKNGEMTGSFGIAS